jgi:hypothetical protein
MKGFAMEICQFVEPDITSRVLNLPGLWSLCVAQSLRILQDYPESRHDEIYGQLSKLELDGDISEFSALCIHAILARSTISDFAMDYLEMAEAVASSHSERAIASEIRAAFDWLQSSPRATPRSIQTILVHDCHAEDFWNDLMITLCQLQDIAAHTVDPAQPPANASLGSDKDTVLLQTRPGATATERYEERAAS